MSHDDEDLPSLPKPTRPEPNEEEKADRMGRVERWTGMTVVEILLAKKMLGAPLLGVAGWIYWLWVAIKLGSVWMFVVGVCLYPITALIGAYSLVFGIPEWVTNMFG